jgi:hypothetical protein
VLLGFETCRWDGLLLFCVCLGGGGETLGGWLSGEPAMKLYIILLNGG